MGLYVDLAATALGILSDFGVGATLNKRVPGAAVPSDGSVPITETGYAVKVVMYNRNVFEVGAIVGKERRMIIAASGLSVVVETGDTVTVGTEILRIEDPNPIAPAGIVVVYDSTVAS